MGFGGVLMEGNNTTPPTCSNKSMTMTATLRFRCSVRYKASVLKNHLQDTPRGEFGLTRRADYSLPYILTTAR